MVIETERLIIRSLQPDDELPFAAMASDGSLHDVGFSSECGRWMKDWIKKAKKLTEADNPTSDYLAYAVVLKEQDEVVGSVGCSYYADLQEVGITYFIGAKYRNCGYAEEATKAYVKYFFHHYDISTLIATVREANIASWKVVEKAGFQFVEKRMYQDINDDNKKKYRFYEIHNIF